MSYSNLNKTFNLETMRLETMSFEDVDVPSLFTRGTKKQRQFVIKQARSYSGRGYSYPWKDPSYEVGDWFWKTVSLKDWDDGNGRPNVPNSDRVGGRVWKTSKAYREDTKQYGYFVERIR